MATPTCLRCLRRSIVAIERPTTKFPRAAAFSTTAIFAAVAKKPGKPTGVASTKKGRTLRLAKRSRTQTARPPAVGERKALRQRIVLSNTNALAVEGLQELTADKLVRHDPNTVALESYAGQVLALNNDTVDALRALESFKPRQAWSLFHRPASLIREETARLANDLADAEGSDKTVARRVLYGAKGSGKSVLLLQAHAMAILRDWIVIHLPEAQDLTNAHTSYQPVTTSDGTVYIQPHYTAKLLSNIARANQSVLSRLHLSQQHRLPIPVQSNISLARFAEMGAQDVEIAWPIWQALWTELRSPSQSKANGGLHRPPVMITMDGVDQAMRESAYLDSEARPIHAHDIGLIRDFMSLLSGRTSLPNGGAIFAATCTSNHASAPTLDFCLKRANAQQEAGSAPSWNPFVARDSRVEAVLRDVQAMQLQGLSKDEARGAMEYYARSGIFRHTVTEGLVSERWTLAGSGIIGELERATVRARF